MLKCEVKKKMIKETTENLSSSEMQRNSRSREVQKENGMEETEKDHKYETLKNILIRRILVRDRKNSSTPFLQEDVLGIMPTEPESRSVISFRPLLLPGITVVISPLISLMKDQVRALNEAGVRRAAYINSSAETRSAVRWNTPVRGRYKIIYVAPERLLTPLFLDFAQSQYQYGDGG